MERIRRDMIMGLILIAIITKKSRRKNRKVVNPTN